MNVFEIRIFIQKKIWPHCAGDRSKPNPNSSGLFDGVTFKKEADDAQEVCNLSILLQLLSAMSLSTPLWLASCTCCNPHCWFSLLKHLEEKQNWNNILRFSLPFFIIAKIWARRRNSKLTKRNPFEFSTILSKVVFYWTMLLKLFHTLV